MALLNKVSNNIGICAIEIAFKSTLLPSTDLSWQPFYNSTIVDNDFQEAYATSGSLSFDEETVRSSAGDSYKQKFSFRFPCTDDKRAERIALIMQAKYIRFKLTSGLWIVFGRNDYFQNTKPLLKMKANKQLCEFEGETQSIYPISYII
jgi:hypothetical protein